jgi:hypothetical protein
MCIRMMLSRCHFRVWLLKRRSKLICLRGSYFCGRVYTRHYHLCLQLAAPAMPCRADHPQQQRLQRKKSAKTSVSDAAQSHKTSSSARMNDHLSATSRSRSSFSSHSHMSKSCLSPVAFVRSPPPSRSQISRRGHVGNRLGSRRNTTQHDTHRTSRDNGERHATEHSMAGSRGGGTTAAAS